MGMFEVKVKLANLAAPSETEEVSLLVDTGATLSWIPRQILQKLGVSPFSRVAFPLADGREVERDVTAVLLANDGERPPSQLPLGSRARKRFWGQPRWRVWDFWSIPSLKNCFRASCSHSGQDRDRRALWNKRVG